MAILGGSGVSLVDLNDALISGVPPRNPESGALWIDTTGGKSVLKVYENGRWVVQKLDVDQLDPDLALKIQGVIDTLGTIANDGILTFSDRTTLAKELGEILGVLPSKTTGNVYPSSLPDYTVLDSSQSGTFANMRMRAVDVGIGTDTAWYKDLETAYKALNTYLSAFTPKPWDITNVSKNLSVTISNPDVFRQTFLDYYMAELRLATETEKQAKIKAQEYTDSLTDGSSVVDKTEVLQGTEIFTDKADDAVVHVDVDGVSVGGGSGKNLFYGQGVKTILQTGDVTWNGSNLYFKRTNGGAYSGGVFTLKTTIGKQYTLSWAVISGFGAIRITAETVSMSTVSSAHPNFVTFTASAETTELVFTYGAGIHDGCTISNIQIEEGSAKTTYEPPAPTPDYPIQIESLNNFDIVSSVGRRNYWITPEEEDLRDVMLGHNVYHSKTEVFEVGGYGSGNVSRVMLGKEIKIDFTDISLANLQSFGRLKNMKPNTKYTMSFLPKHDKLMGSLRMYKLMGLAYYDDSMKNIRQSYEFTTDSMGDYKFEMWSDNSNARPIGMIFTISDITITTGYETKAVSVEEIDYDTKSDTLYKTNITLPEPLRSVGDVKDRIYMDNDGFWKIERNVGEVVFGKALDIQDRTIVIGDNSKTNWYQFSTNVQNALDGLGSSSHFGKINDGYADDVHLRVKSLGTQGLAPSMFFERDRFASTLEVQNWLESEKAAGRPVSLNYIKGTPTTETLSQEFQTKLNNIQSFKGDNYVYTLHDKSGIFSPNLKATFKSKAWYRNYVNEQELKGLDGALKDQEQAVKDLKDYTDGSFKDGVVSASEAKSIGTHLNTLAKDKKDIDSNYTTIYGNTKLTGAPKTSLYNAKVAWNTAYAGLTTAITTASSGGAVTPGQIATVNSMFVTYGDALKLLTQRNQEAMTAINKSQADESAQGAVDTSQDYTDRKTGAPVRYIRDWQNGSTANTGNIWVELQANTSSGVNRARGILPTSNLALVDAVRLTDGVTAHTPYVRGTPGLQYVQIDLGKIYYDINDVSVWHYHGDGRTYHESKTEISMDGENWEPLFDSAIEGEYPATPEGKTFPTNLVDRMREITSRVSLAEQIITPEAITGIVMSQDTFVTWKETVDDKANGEDVEKLVSDMDNVNTALNGTEEGEEGILTKLSRVEQTSESWGTSIEELQTITNSQGEVTSSVTSYMEFKSTGLEIGKSDSDMKVNISNSQIDFMDKGISVAYINGQKMYITHVEIKDSLTIGNHKFSKLEGSKDVTIINWIGK